MAREDPALIMVSMAGQSATTGAFQNGSFSHGCFPFFHEICYNLVYWQNLDYFFTKIIYVNNPVSINENCI